MRPFGFAVWAFRRFWTVLVTAHGDEIVRIAARPQPRASGILPIS